MKIDGCLGADIRQSLGIIIPREESTYIQMN
jgi:hypothetical protein